MALDKKPLNEKEKFETEVYKLGITLVENYLAGNCRDSNKTLEAVIELFKISRGVPTEGIGNGI